jgi:succinate dehydrogenase / fumarate reductase iron-sulfur subunit
MGQFYAQYEKIKPYLLNNGQNPPAREHLQCLSSVRNSMVCTSVFLCMLSTSCPSFWWNPDKFIGPAGLLAAYRFLIDSRDTETERAAWKG